MEQLTWGDVVKVKANAPSALRPGEFASICGILVVDTEKQARSFNTKIGDSIYLVEFSDGEALEVSSRWLEPLDSS